MSRLALITASAESDWRSCQTIVKNLLTAYQSLSESHSMRCFGLTEDSSSTWALSEEITKWNPDFLVFVDHTPHPYKLLSALNVRYQDRQLPRMVFHIFGDFTLNSSEWWLSDQILKKTQVKLFCASYRQAALVQNFLNDRSNLAVCPFPVDTDFFNSSSELRGRWRKKFRIPEDDFVVVYGGRISLQKNVTRMLAICDSCYELGVPIRVLIAGTFDNIGAPFFKINYPMGYFYEYFDAQRASLSKNFSKRVSYVGNLNDQQLRGLYNAADSYFSLSLHHDEDFGMGPAEALACGTPAVLSNWGGYASFSNESEDVRLIPVRFSNTGLKFSTEKAEGAILANARNQYSSTRRSERSKDFANRFGLSAVASILRNSALEEVATFGGFNWKLKFHSERLNDESLFSDGIGRGSFYRELYSSYIGL